MSEHEGRGARAVYDHEVEDPRRRRAVADWGVGEEIFDRMPRRRLRHGEDPRRDRHARERRSGRLDGVGEEPRPQRFESVREEPRPQRFESVREEPRVEAPRPRRVEPAAGERRFEAAADERRFAPAADERRFERRVEEPRPAAPAEEETVPPLPRIEDVPPAVEADRAPAGRRTVVIRGRGAERAWTPRYRPPRTVGERIGPRPDRLAAWAVALGLLLILIAVLTAHG
jgi:hypothetical protein